MATSQQMQLNKEDYKAIGKSALVWATPVILIYINAVLGTIQANNHVFVFADLLPTTFTWGAITAWFYMQIQGALIRLVKPPTA